MDSVTPLVKSSKVWIIYCQLGNPVTDLEIAHEYYFKATELTEHNQLL